MKSSRTMVSIPAAFMLLVACAAGCLSGAASNENELSPTDRFRDGELLVITRYEGEAIRGAIQRDDGRLLANVEWNLTVGELAVVPIDAERVTRSFDSAPTLEFANAAAFVLWEQSRERPYDPCGDEDCGSGWPAVCDGGDYCWRTEARETCEDCEWECVPRIWCND